MPRRTLDPAQITILDAPPPRRAARKPRQKAPPSIPAVVKTVRNVMRKDKGLEGGDLDRLYALTWLLLLKFLDDREHVWEAEALADGHDYVPVLEAPYRWRDWAAQGTFTGDDLLRFFEQDEALRPDGTRGPGLLFHLRGLRERARTARQRVVGEVFDGVRNRMESGYLLHDVTAALSALHFDRTADVQAIGAVYETMLREMRDAAGSAGEFYTPRPLVRFLVERLDPRPGETVLDPACGTGGFLVAAFEHLRAGVATPEVRRAAEAAVTGIEAKRMPYLLAQMNLLLHGVDEPRVQRTNALAVTLSSLGPADQVDVVLANPPFGGEEEESILRGFPRAFRTRETAFLFLALILRRLRRPLPAEPDAPAGRAAVVVPNGTLFDATGQGVREELLRRYRLHTVVRLPEGVFEPYTAIPANVLFFDASGPTETVWFYELPRPEGRKKYTKTQPLRDADLDALRAWWADRQETAQAWPYDFAAALTAAEADAQPLRAAADAAEAEADRRAADARRLGGPAPRAPLPPDVQARRDALLEQAAARRAEAAQARAEADALMGPVFNLDRKNPHAEEVADPRTPAEILAALHARAADLTATFARLDTLLAADAVETGYPRVQLGEVLRRSTETISIKPDLDYRQVTVRLFGRGVTLRNEVSGAEIGTGERYRVRSGQFILSKIDARNGAFGIVPAELDEAVVSGDFPVFNEDPNRLLSAYLGWLSRAEWFVEQCAHASKGTTNRVRLQEADFLSLSIPLPPLDVQQRIVADLEEVEAVHQCAEAMRADLDALRAAALRRALGAG